jgi:RNA polymerase sigma-70 factor (ECF subfamily)
VNKTDTSLVIKAIEGDEFALNRLLNQWYQPIFRYAFKYFGEREIALEVTQKSFIKVANKLSMLNEPEYFQAWLYKIVANQCHEEVRRAKSKKLSQWFSLKGDSIVSLDNSRKLENVLTNTSEDTDFSIVENQRNALLQQGLQTLSEELRSVLVLKHYQDLTFREIAEITDVSENTVKTRLYSALKKLKTYFEKDQTIKAELWYE